MSEKTPANCTHKSLFVKVCECIHGSTSAFGRKYRRRGKAMSEKTHTGLLRRLASCNSGVVLVKSRAVS